MKVLATIIIGALVVVIVGAVVLTRDNNEPQMSSAPTQETATPHVVRPVDQALLDAIASGEEEGVGMVPVRGAAVRSADYEKVYFVAMEFSATGIENQVGLWATNDLGADGLIFAVDGTAKAFTSWGHGDQTDANMTIFSDGAQEATAALGQ
jgi:hypothetical protein